MGDLNVATCVVAVSVLDARDIGSGKKKASDAAYGLAVHLLAAKLNVSNGATTCAAAVSAIAAAQALLDGIDFDGTGNYLRSKHPDYKTARNLAEILDSYNNNELCTQ